MNAHNDTLPETSNLAAAFSSGRAGQRAANVVEPRKTALLVGVADPHLRALFVDVLNDIGLDVSQADAAPSSHGAPDVVLTLIESAADVGTVKLMRRRFQKAPVLAILPIGMKQVAPRAVAAGAQACYLLGMPLMQLRGLLNALLSDTPKPAHAA